MAKNKPTNKKKMSGPRIAALIVTIAILLGLVVSLLAGGGFFIRIQSGAKSENFKVNGSMMAYYANTYVNNWMQQNIFYIYYGAFNPQLPYSSQVVPGEKTMTFHDLFASGTKSMVEQYLKYCEAAMDDAEFDYDKVSGEAEAYAKKQVEEIKKAAKESGASYKEYIRNAIGHNISKSDLRKALEIEYIAAEYAKVVYDRFDGATDDSREDKYFKDHFENFIVAEYIVYKETAPETVNPNDYTLGKEDPKYKEAVEKAKKANEFAKIEAQKALDKLATAKTLDEFKTMFLELKYDDVFTATYNTFVKNWTTLDKPSDEIRNAYKEEFKNALIDAAVKDLDELPKEEEATPADESTGEGTGSTTKPSKWDTNKETFSKNLIAALKKSITDSTTTAKYTLDTDLGKFLFASVKKDFGIDPNAKPETESAKANDPWVDHEEFTSDDDKAIAKYSMSHYFVTKAAYRDEEKVRDVSHILFKVDEKGTNGAYTTKEAAKAAAEKLLEEIKASAVDGKVSKEKFTEFAQVTHDSNISYTIKKDGQMVEAFETWVFDATEEGQLGLVETEYGYHIMYYGGEDISWRKSAHSSAISEDVDAWYKGLSYEIKVNEKLFADILS